MDLQKQSLMNDFDQKVKKLTRQQQSEMESLIQDNLVQTKRLNEEFGNTMQLMEEKVTVLKNEVIAWEERYRCRESRPEDVARLMELEHIVRENEDTIKRQAEEMKFFKLELINREENFNKMFSRSPNVGVMQVVKPTKPPLAFQDSIHSGNKVHTRKASANNGNGSFNQFGSSASIQGGGVKRTNSFSSVNSRR